MRLFAAIALSISSLLGGGAALASERAETAPAPTERVSGDNTITILVALDGFRADYLDRGLTPNLAALAERGVRGSMQPSFPSVTLPNFYTMMTGKAPDHHGIVGNEFEREDGVSFGTDYWNPRWWNGALPLWASIEAQGGRTAHVFYPGVGVDASGERPREYLRYTEDIAPADEPAELFKWLDVPADEQPRFLTIWFYPADHQGHDYGPNSPELDAALAEIDGAVGTLLAGLQQRGLLERTNLVVVADHGMTEVPPGQLVFLDDLVEADSIRPISLGSYAAIEPAEGATVDAIAAKLVGRHSHAECWRKEDLPARFRFGTHARIAPIVCLAENGWILTTRADVESEPERYAVTRGGHGYDPADPEMAAIFIADGPAFRSGATVPKFENRNLYFLLAKLTGVTPLPGDGSTQPFENVLTAP